MDFSLSHFLDRFAFKNPKKDSEPKSESLVQSFHSKQYTSYGSRGKPVKQLSAANCTEDEKFIFEYLDKKRERQAALGVSGDQSDALAVDDDEFDAYLDTLGGKKSKNDGLDDDEFDIVRDFGEGKVNVEEDAEDWDSDGDDDDDNEDGGEGSEPMDDE